MKLEEQIKRINVMMLTESEMDRPVSSTGGGTSTSSSGSFEGDAFEQGGIFSNNGRKDDIGELPQVIDITGGDSEEITLSVDDMFGTDPSVDVMQVIDNLIGTSSPIGPGDSKGDDIGPGGPRGGDYGDPHGGDDDGPGGPGDYGDDGDDGDDGYDPHSGPGKPTREPEEPRDSMDFVPCCEPCGNGMWKRCNTDDCVYSTISDCELRGKNKTYSESKKSRTTFNN
tara:strand:+ start:1264 stop:1941 length:678 start_codon:yes stop_codon:yes gene_type:complete